MRQFTLPVAVMAVSLAGILLTSSSSSISVSSPSNFHLRNRSVRAGSDCTKSSLHRPVHRCTHLRERCWSLSSRLRGGEDEQAMKSPAPAPAQEPGSVQEHVEEIQTQGADPQAAEAAKVKGNDAYKRRDFTKAIEMYTQAIELDPSNPVFLNNRAAVYLAQDKLDEAELDVQKAIQLEKKKPVVDQDDKALGRSYLRLGSIHHKRENFTGAIYWYKNSIVEHSFPETSMKLRESEKVLSFHFVIFSGSDLDI